MNAARRKRKEETKPERCAAENELIQRVLTLVDRKELPEQAHQDLDGFKLDRAFSDCTWDRVVARRFFPTLPRNPSGLPSLRLVPPGQVAGLHATLGPYAVAALASIQANLRASRCELRILPMEDDVVYLVRFMLDQVTLAIQNEFCDACAHVTHFKLSYQHANGDVDDAIIVKEDGRDSVTLVLIEIKAVRETLVRHLGQALTQLHAAKLQYPHAMTNILTSLTASSPLLVLQDVVYLLSDPCVFGDAPDLNATLSWMMLVYYAARNTWTKMQQVEN